jgi:aerobic-type carbon monoxide dehydrogenase small subunit (CoxS/CutS family)
MSDDSSLKILGNTSKAVSRRRFIQGVIGGGAAVCASSYLFRGSTVHGIGGAGERLISLNVNGQVRRADVMKQETLAWTLRYKLGLTGTKLGCDRAECGACTVLIDDVPHYSCSVLTHTVRGRNVVTIEGLASQDGTLHPVQQGVIDEQGFQCAFCMSGIHHGHGGVPQNQSEPQQVGVGARYFREPVPMSGLRQDPHRDDARRGKYEEREPCLNLLTSVYTGLNTS